MQVWYPIKFKDADCFIEFELPKEALAHNDAINGSKYRRCIDAIQQELKKDLRPEKIVENIKRLFNE